MGFFYVMDNHLHSVHILCNCNTELDDFVLDQTYYDFHGIYNLLRDGLAFHTHNKFSDLIIDHSDDWYNYHGSNWYFWWFALLIS